MSISFYEISVVDHVRGLKVLAHLLEKAKAHATEKNIPIDELVEWTLIDDMKPLSFQVQTVCNSTKNAMVNCAHQTMPAVEDNEKTFADLEARIVATQKLLQGLDAASINEKAAEPAAVPEALKSRAPPGITGLQFFLHFNNANFNFHLATAYAILRSKGVDIGKRDWLSPRFEGEH